MVRVQVEDEVGAEPPFLLHRRGVRRFVVCARVVRMSRSSGGEERPQLLFARESEVPLDVPGRPEHESELSAPEAVRKGWLCRHVVSPELLPKEAGRGFLRRIRDYHSSSHPSCALKGSRERTEARLSAGHIEDAKPEKSVSPCSRAMNRTSWAWCGSAILFAALYGGVPLAGLAIDRAVGLSPLPLAVRLVGPALLFAGAAGLIWCFALFAKAGGTPNPVMPPEQLVTAGPYASAPKPVPAARLPPAPRAAPLRGRPPARPPILL